jgi:prepilin-type N-terminal cleavage/methylation domain-containing protein
MCYIGKRKISSQNKNMFLEKNKSSKGFTLVELLVVIAIIGILTSIVMVSTQGALDKSKRASALTTASSVLPEIATCSDDGGDISFPASATTGGTTICLTPGTNNPMSGHTVAWPSLSNSGGWTYANTSTKVLDANIPTMQFTINKAAGSAYANILCDYPSSTCQ